MPLRSTRILYLVPEMIGPPGGIARYCKMVCEALGPYAELHVLSLFDRPGDIPEDGASLPLKSYRAFNGNRTLFIAMAIAKLLEHPAVLILGHSFFAPLGWLMSKISRAPWVVFIYGKEVWFRHPISRRIAMRRCDKCFAISNFTADRAHEVNGIPRELMTILNNCLDPAFTPDRDTTLHPETSLLTVSRLATSDPYKGHSLVLSIMPALCSRFPGLIYHIIGDGDARGALEAQAFELGVAPSVVFHGIVSDEELLQHYRRAGVFVMPSSSEGFGFVFLEAMAQGTPVIGGDRDATPEVIDNGVTGYVIDPSDPQALYEAICKVIGADATRAHMGKAAVRRAVEVFGFSVFSDKLRSEIRLVVEPQSLNLLN